MRKLIVAILTLFPVGVMAQTANYPEVQLAPAYAADSGAANALVASVAFGCPTAYTTGMVVKVLPNHANSTTTPTLNFCGLGAKTITKFGTAALVANDLTTTAVAFFVYDGTDMELQNPQTTSTYSGTITSVATTSPITGGTVTSGGVTVACATCVTAAASLGSTYLVTGATGQAVAANANDQVAAGGIFTTYDNIATAGLGFPVVEGVSDKTAQSASLTTQNLITSTGAAGHYLVRFYIDQNALCTTGTGSVLATVTWTDSTASHTATTIPMTLTNTTISTANGFINAAIPFWSASGDAISYTTTYVACTSGTGTYDLHAEVERTN